MFDLVWIPVRDGDPMAYSIMRRHYSFRRYGDGRRKNPSKVIVSRLLAGVISPVGGWIANGETANVKALQEALL